MTKTQLDEAREWLADLVFEDEEPEDFALMSDRSIERGIAIHYDGGIGAFVSASNLAWVCKV